MMIKVPSKHKGRRLVNDHKFNVTAANMIVNHIKLHKHVVKDYNEISLAYLLCLINITSERKLKRKS